MSQLANEEEVETSETPAEETLETSEELEETEDDEVVDDEDEDDGLSETDRSNALNIYKALQDPKRSLEIIRAMAHGAGILTPATQEKAEQTIQEILSESLGPNYGFLAEKLGPAIEKIVSQQVNKGTKPLQETLAERERAETSARVDAALTTIFSNPTKYPGAKELQPQMLALVQELPAAPGITPLKYFTHLYHLAKANAAADPKKVAAAKSHLPGKLSSSGSSAGVAAAPTKMTADAAIKAAMKQLGME